ncbi:hypothetical protein GGI43DRAFT_427532 [Trichoderma evansii]
MSEIKKVIVVGAGGFLNPVVISSLQSYGFSVSVLVRDSSNVVPPTGTTVYRTDYSESSLLLAFKGQDAVVNTITMPDFEQQKKMIDIAVLAGVKRFIPAEFGIDTSKEETVEIMTFLKMKPQVIQYLRSIQDKITWTGIITGPFFDWSLRQGFFSFDVPSRTAYIHQPGHHTRRFSWSNLANVAEAVAHVLFSQNFPIVDNRYVHVRSFNASQDDILQSLISATKRLDTERGQDHTEWKIIDVDLEEKVLEARNKLAQGDTGSLGYILSKAIYRTGGNYDSEGVVMNEKLGMKLEESLDATVEREVAKLLP